MKPGWTHRLRLHKLGEVERYVQYSGWWEGGRIDHLLRCSCGRCWIRHQNSLTGKVTWS